MWAQHFWWNARANPGSLLGVLRPTLYRGSLLGACQLAGGSAWSRDLLQSGTFSINVVVLIWGGVSRYCDEFVNLADGLILSTPKPNSECFSNQNNHVSCRNLTCVLNMSNYLKEFLKYSTSLLVVYPMLVAFAEAVPLAMYIKF